MIIMTTTGNAQTFKVIPREYVTNATLTIRDDSSNVSKTYTGLTQTTSVNHLQVAITFNPVLKEGRYYDLTLKKADATVIYKDKIFCTDQTINQAADQEYTVNKDEYTSDTSYDNDFIIL